MEEHNKESHMLNIQIVYALPEKPTMVDCQVADGCDVLQAITQSNILSQCQINLTDHYVGIYGKLVELTQLVNNGDRIEIYRKLINDPKEIRRKRAALKKSRG